MNALILLGLVALALLLWFVLRRAPTPRIVSHDASVLRSERLALIGRPDRILRLENGTLIPVEKKPGRILHDSHRAQLGVYLILIEEQTGVRPPYGIVSLDGDAEHCVENSEALRRWTDQLIEAVRAVRIDPDTPCIATPFPAKCRSCSVEARCSASLA